MMEEIWATGTLTGLVNDAGFVNKKGVISYFQAGITDGDAMRRILKEAGA